MTSAAVEPGTTVRARAPVRIGFAGGGSDVPPYCWNHGGHLVTTAVDRYAHAACRVGGDEIRLRATDLDARGTFGNGMYRDDGLDLLRAVVAGFNLPTGVELSVTSDLPAGAGMGGSSAIAVAAVACLARVSGQTPSAERVAWTAYHAEREELDEHGGFQDQFAAAHGGLVRMTSGADRTVTIEPLGVSPETRRALERRSLLYYTGDTHDSDAIHEELADRYERNRPTERERRDRLRRAGVAVDEALRDDDLARFGAALHEGWEVKKRLSPRVSTPLVEEAYETARANGASGGKLLGAGGGGHVYLFAEPGRTLDVIDAMRDLPVERVPFAFEPDGVTTWREEAGR